MQKQQLVEFVKSRPYCAVIEATTAITPRTQEAKINKLERARTLLKDWTEQRVYTALVFFAGTPTFSSRKIDHILRVQFESERVMSTLDRLVAKLSEPQQHLANLMRTALVRGAAYELIAYPSDPNPTKGVWTFFARQYPDLASAGQHTDRPQLVPYLNATAGLRGAIIDEYVAGILRTLFDGAHPQTLIETNVAYHCEGKSDMDIIVAGDKKTIEHALSSQQYFKPINGSTIAQTERERRMLAYSRIQKTR